MENVIYMKGPMHPDLFDGETPMMIAVPVKEAGKVFDVEINFTINMDESYSVVALNEDDAKKVAKEMLAEDYHDIDDIFCSVCESDIPASESMLKDFIARMEDAA